MKSFFSAESGQIWIKFCRLHGAEWHVDCGDMVKIETRCRIPIRRTFGWIPWHFIPESPATLKGAATGRIQQHVIPEPRITLQGAATWWIHCHDSRAICHIAGCSQLAKSMSDCATLWVVRIPSAILKIVFCHILFLFLFFCQCSLGFDEQRLSYHIRYTCYLSNIL